MNALRGLVVMALLIVALGIAEHFETRREAPDREDTTMILTFPIHAPVAMRIAQPDSRLPGIRSAVRAHCQLHHLSAADTTASINQAIAQLTNGVSGAHSIKAGKDHADRLRKNNT